MPSPTSTEPRVASESPWLLGSGGAASQALALCVLRAFVGLMLLVYHGLPKLAAAPGYFARGEAWRDVDLVRELGLPFPGVMALLAGLAQSVGAAAMAAGFLTRIQALVVASTLVVAVYANLSHGKDNQAALFYLGASVVVIIGGGGPCSVDAWWRGRKGGRS